MHESDSMLLRTQMMVSPGMTKVGGVRLGRILAKVDGRKRTGKERAEKGSGHGKVLRQVGNGYWSRVRGH